MTEQQPLILTDRIIAGRTGVNSHIPEIELQLEVTNVRLRSLNGQCFWLSFFEGKKRMFVEVQDSWKRFSVGDSPYNCLLHFAPTDRPHRVAIFKFISGGHSS